MNVRVGFGFDVHQLKENHPFFLGGVKLDHTKGAYGHSDADVLIHAICDALLGAAGLKDIGYYFPNTDARYKNIDSKKLLLEVVDKIREKGYLIGNVDATVTLENPKLSPHVDKMKQILSECMQVSSDCVSIKATTNEKLGYVGREEGVNAQAVALIYTLK